MIQVVEQKDRLGWVGVVGGGMCVCECVGLCVCVCVWGGGA